MNRLAGEKSAYLNHASDQKIDWYPWSDEAFARSRQEDKPLFLSTGAVWCHWCHVMAKECFYDEGIVKILNENFISIKLDRDERPDIDRRYQMAVAAMGAGGGWPLTVFMTPEKVPFYGGTYFPPEDKMGRPGFKKVLAAVYELYKTKKPEIAQYTEKLMNALKSGAAHPGEINEELLFKAVENILSEFDPQNGGFGSSPKFPMPGAMDFLISRYFLTGDESIGLVVRKTLESMALGGFHDQIGGGFHRYSTDAAWTIPHFEKMADDNAWLLRNYLNAYSVLGDEAFRVIAEGIVNFISSVLSDPAGGFYASQDADVTPDDEGGYFTWTDKDLRDALDDEEYELLSLHLMHDAGSMHHDKSKKVLFVAMTAKQIAEKTGRDVAVVNDLIRRGKDKMLEARNKRETPFIDKSMYTSINGMLISSFLLGYRTLGDVKLRDFALKSLERVMALNYLNKNLFHTEGVKALLDDYVYLADALLGAYEVTGDGAYLSQAEEITDLCITKLWDRDSGGFFDSEDHLLGVSIKGIEDIPHPSANALAIRLLIKLFLATGKDIYNQHAEKALKNFSPRADEIGIHGSYYFSALEAYHNMMQISLYTGPSNALSEAAMSLPSQLTSLVYKEDRGHVIPCIRGICYEPVYDVSGLREFYFGKKYLKKA